MKEYKIDMTGVYTPDDLYDRMEGMVSFPEYFGRNLDALHDVLTDMRQECVFIFEDTQEAEVLMPRFMKNLRRLFHHLEEENPKVKGRFPGE